MVSVETTREAQMPSYRPKHLRYSKPYPTFPLSPHPRGWAKKIKGKVYIICGHIPPNEAEQVFYKKAPKIMGLEIKMVVGRDTTKEAAENTAPAAPPAPIAPQSHSSS